MSVLLLNERGLPQPPSAVLARLRDLDDALGLFWHPMMGCWCVTWRWPIGDARWARVQSGELPEAQAFDVLAYAPKDCTADDVPQYLEKNIQKAERPEIQRLFERTAEFNRKRQLALVEEALPAVMDGVTQTMRRQAKGKRA